MGRLPNLKIVESVTKNTANSEVKAKAYPRLVGQLWSSKKRQLHSLHYAVPFRGSFKPELPDFCIRRYSNKGDVVLDPFSGRGTTALQANLLERVAWASDINPLSVRITKAKLSPIGLDELLMLLPSIKLNKPVEMSGYQEIFSPFFNQDTYRELVNLKKFLLTSESESSSFLELIASSRLHGHSDSFFSAYSFPQIAITPDNQRLLNLKRSQKPEYRAVAPRIIKKAAQSLRDGFSSSFFDMAPENIVETSDARNLNWAPSDSVDLIVTSPPGLDSIDYFSEYWLSCWFLGISRRNQKLVSTNTFDFEDWQSFMLDFLKESLRVLKKHGHAVIEMPQKALTEKFLTKMSSTSMLSLDDELIKLVKKVTFMQKRFAIEEVLINQHKTSKLTKSYTDVSSSESTLKASSSNKLLVLRCEAHKTRRR